MTAEQIAVSATGISKNAACTSFFAAAISLTLITLLHILEPEFDPSWRFVSEYANGPFGWLLLVSFEAMALSFGALAFALKDEARTASAKVGLMLLCLSTLGCAVAGIFPIDSIEPLLPEPTFNGSIHGLATMVGIPTLPIGAMLLTYGLTNDAVWQPSKTRLRLFANLTWISLVAMFVLMSVWMSASGGKFGPDVPIGWLNRLAVLAYLTWTILMAAAAAGISQRPDAAKTESNKQ